MHIYAFGSVCRGDISRNSDVDLLAIVDGYDDRFNDEVYSIYSYKRIQEIWAEGNPFAWHLALEARLIHSSDGSDVLKKMASPQPYQLGLRDCEKFFALFCEAQKSLKTNRFSTNFDLSMTFLAIRNIATCFSLAVLRKPVFSRSSALHLGEHSLTISEQAYGTLERARILCTRGLGTQISADEIQATIEQFPKIEGWMARLVEEARDHAT